MFRIPPVATVLRLSSAPVVVCLALAAGAQTPNPATSAAKGTAKPGAWVDLLPKSSLAAWQSVGDGFWNFLPDGTLVGQRDIRGVKDKGWFADKKDYDRWVHTQAWLYTKQEFREFDLHVEFWLHVGGNSGISIRDTSRAQHAVGPTPDFTKTPARLAYEIQLSNAYPDKWTCGSIYRFAPAKDGVMRENAWNAIDIESRDNSIRVKLNGQLVAEHPGDPARSKSGPIGLQLHDQFSFAMFRNVRIRELAAAGR